MVKNRIFYYDFLRAFAIFSVVLCHMAFFFGDLNTLVKVLYEDTAHAIGLMGVPIFLMLTGALLLNREYTFSSFFKKRFLRIAPPAIFWLIITLLFEAFVLKVDSAGLYRVFIGNGSVMWYIWMLIGIYLFMPVINSFIKDMPRAAEYYIIIWFVTIILRTFQIWPVFPDFKLNCNFELNYFADFMGYVVLGYYLDNKEFKLKDAHMLIISVLIFIVTLCVFLYLNIKGINRGPTYQNISNVFLGIGGFMIVKYIDKLHGFDKIKDNIIGKAIVSLSTCSYGIYLSHMIFYKFFREMHFHSNKIVPVMLIIILGSSWLLVWILSKIPYINKFSGA